MISAKVPSDLRPVHMEVGDPGEVRYPSYPWSKKLAFTCNPGALAEWCF